MLISGKYWKIKLNRYETKARIGAYQHERLLPQRLRLNVSVYVEKGAAPVNELSEVFNYDRIIEAIEVEDHPFAVGVQWHPECMYKTSREMRNLFLRFVAAGYSKG